jgi:hypothetical protein
MKINDWVANTNKTTQAHESSGAGPPHLARALINDMLADMCDLIGKTLALIPTEYDKERLSACAFVLDDQVRHQSDME